MTAVKSGLLLALVGGLVGDRVQDPSDLIRKLGSDRLEDRIEAEKRLLELGERVRPLLLKAEIAPDSEIAGRAKGVLKILDDYALLDQLVAEYQAFGLPLAPENAPLVRCPSGRSSVKPSGKYVPYHTLGFLVEENTVLRGMVEHDFSARDAITETAPEAGSENGLEAASGWEFKVNSLLATALQCKARGWNAFAWRLYQVAMKEPYDRFIHLEDDEAALTPSTAVALLAWSQRLNELYGMGDRKDLLRSMKAIQAAAPRLNTDSNRDLLQSLEASLRPCTSAPGTVEFMIDRLLNLSPFDEHWPGPPFGFTRLVRLGIGSAPALIDHLDDKRLTRYRSYEGIRHFPGTPWEVSWIVSRILESMGWQRPKEEDAGKLKAHARQWLEEVKAKGEEAYFVSRALAGEWPDRAAISVLGGKYPSQLPVLYRKILQERPEMQSWPLADEIARCDLAREAKLEVLKGGLAHPKTDHRYGALCAMDKVDAGEQQRLLREVIDRFPPTGSDSETRFLHLVRKSTDARVWEALLKAARRADSTFRSDILRNLHAGDTRLGRDFLASFLEDPDVRNLAAQKLASILELDADPDPSWGEPEWASLRAEVRKSLENNVR